MYKYVFLKYYCVLGYICVYTYMNHCCKSSIFQYCVHLLDTYDVINKLDH